MKTVITFEFSDEDSAETIQTYTRAMDLHSALWEIHNYLRNVRKYQDFNISTEDMHNDIIQIIESNGIDDLFE